MENYQEIDAEICQICDTPETIEDSIESITYSFNTLNVNSRPNLLLIEKLVEKFTKEMQHEKIYDEKSEYYYLRLSPPIWFYEIDSIYQQILLNLLEPIFNNIKKIEN